jgi:hypothetical protein
MSRNDAYPQTSISAWRSLSHIKILNRRHPSSVRGLCEVPGYTYHIQSFLITSGTLLQLFMSFIRPHLEYCSVVWDPYLVKDVELLEKTQRFGLKVCLKDWSSDYTSLLSRANIATLSICEAISSQTISYVQSNAQTYRFSGCANVQIR